VHRFIHRDRGWLENRQQTARVEGNRRNVVCYCRACRLKPGTGRSKKIPTAEAAGELMSGEVASSCGGMCTERPRPIWPNAYCLSVKRFTSRVPNAKQAHHLARCACFSAEEARGRHRSRPGVIPRTRRRTAGKSEADRSAAWRSLSRRSPAATPDSQSCKGLKHDELLGSRLQCTVSGRQV
jgi:hypothetical protein